MCFQDWEIDTCQNWFKLGSELVECGRPIAVGPSTNPSLNPDLDGNPRPIGGVILCYEYVNSPEPKTCAERRKEDVIYDHPCKETVRERYSPAIGLMNMRGVRVNGERCRRCTNIKWMTPSELARVEHMPIEPNSDGSRPDRW